MDFHPNYNVLLFPHTSDHVLVSLLLEMDLLHKLVFYNTDHLYCLQHYKSEQKKIKTGFKKVLKLLTKLQVSSFFDIIFKNK